MITAFLAEPHILEDLVAYRSQKFGLSRALHTAGAREI